MHCIAVYGVLGTDKIKNTYISGTPNAHVPFVGGVIVGRMKSSVSPNYVRSFIALRIAIENEN